MHDESPFDTAARRQALVPVQPQRLMEIVDDPDIRTIFVNGRPCQVREKEIGHHDLVRLAFPGGSLATVPDTSSLTVTYQRGPAIAAEGILSPLERTLIANGEVFNVTRTDQS